MVRDHLMMVRDHLMWGSFNSILKTVVFIPTLGTKIASIASGESNLITDFRI